jgi:hypothetical protein
VDVRDAALRPLVAVDLPALLAAAPVRWEADRLDDDDFELEDERFEAGMQLAPDCLTLARAYPNTRSGDA